LTLEGKVAVKVTVGDLECKTTPSSTDREVLCSPPSLTTLQQYFEQNKKSNYNIEKGVDNNTERKKRDNNIKTRKKVETPKQTHFEVKVVMGNLERSPGFLEYKITSGSPLESPVRHIFIVDYLAFRIFLVLLYSYSVV
jgi:hypothetical protein